MKKKNLGILLMFLFAFSHSAMQIFIKLSSNVPTMEKMFVRNLMNMFLAFLIIKKRKRSLFGGKKYQWGLFMRDFFSFMGMTCMFYASAKGNQADITILNKMSPFFITIFASIFLKEKLSKIQIPALILSFCGAYFIGSPQFNSDMLPLYAALFSAITTGVSYTMLSYFRDKVDGWTVIMHFSTFCVLCSSIALLTGLGGEFVVPMGMDLVKLLLVGVFGILGQVTVTYAYRLAPASEISIYNYVGILFSTILGYFVLGEKIGLNSIVGGGTVIFASVMVYIYNRRQEREL